MFLYVCICVPNVFLYIYVGMQTHAGGLTLQQRTCGTVFVCICVPNVFLCVPNVFSICSYSYRHACRTCATAFGLLIIVTAGVRVYTGVSDTSARIWGTALGPLIVVTAAPIPVLAGSQV